MNWDDLIKAEIAATNNNLSEWTGEFGGTPVTIYAKPLCPADHDAIAKQGYRDFFMNPTMGGMVAMIMRKAQDENGNRIFPKPNVHGPLLHRVGQTKIAEIFTALFGADIEAEDDEAFEARVGNSAPTKNG